MADPIKTGTRPDGSTYYWFRVSAGRDATGKRIQVYKSGDDKKKLLTEYAKVIVDVAERRFIAPSDITVSGYLDKWVKAYCRNLEEGSRAQVRHSLAYVRERLGKSKMQDVDRWAVERLVDWMAKSGRRRGGKPGTGLGPVTINRMLTLFQSACEDAVDEKLIPSNPCRRVKRAKMVKAEHDLWSDDETARFEKVAAEDRLHPVITLQCLGLRPEEVCGLKWAAIDLSKRTLRIRLVRTLVDGDVVEKEPKTEAGKRTLPLDDALADMLRKWRKQLAAEKLAAGEAYEAGGYVLCDELGRPLDPAKLRRVWYRLMRQAGVRKVKPYTASRHAAGSYLSRMQVSPAIIAAWLGHTDASFTMKTYVHARPEDLATARDALAARKAAKG